MAALIQPLVAPINIFTASPVTAPGTGSGTTGNYGLTVIPISNGAGNALVAYIAWNSATVGRNPVSSLADDAHNVWTHLGTAPVSNTVRCAIWIAPDAQPASFVAVATSLPNSALSALIAELPSLPTTVVVGYPETSAGATSTTSVTASSIASAPCWGFAVLASGNNTDAIAIPGAPWSPLGTVVVNDPAGAGGPADLTLTPVYGSIPAGPVSVTYTSSGAQPMAVELAGILQTPPALVYRNPNRPILSIEAAVGGSPGDPTGMPVWTDITSRAIQTETDVALDTSRGRAYELTQPDNGQTTIWFDNHDGGLSPTNTGGPYFPSVLLQTAVRVTATWNDHVYPIAYGRVDKWPQQWPDPQWGMSPMQMSDHIGVLANLTLYSSYQSEVILDQPYAYWTLSEQYGEADGLPFSNLAETDAKALIGVDGQSNQSGAVTPLSTGLTLDLQGDTGSGIGISGLTSSAPPFWSAGAMQIDPSLPQIGASGITVEFWASVGTSSFNYLTPLLTLAGQPSNYPNGAGQIRFQAAAGLTAGIVPVPYLQTTMGDFLGGAFTDTGGNIPADDNPHHHVFTISYSSPHFTIQHYLDGDLERTITTSGVVNSQDVFQLIVGPAIIAPTSVIPYNYTMAHVAIYAKTLTPQRIQSHYQSGIFGFSGDSVAERFTRIMAWGESGLPKAADSGSPTPLMGAADTIQGQDNVSALYDVTTSEGGMIYADAQGNVWYQSRVYVYDRPAKWVFGDNPAAGETPYEPDTSFDYDNSFLYTQVQAARQIGINQTVETDTVKGALILTFKNDGAQVVATDLTAEAKYGRRNSLQQQVLTTSDEDASDRANWSLNKYRQPALRVPQLTLDPVSNPSIWPVALGVEQGDIVTVHRRPLGAAPYTVTGLVQQVKHAVGPTTWTTTLAISPLTIETDILLVGTGPFNTLAEGIGW
jgi:hypothetical protein